MISAVMQPYLFPYLGYYQLVNSVDKFVFYDDVNFIKQGYINRNSILSNGQALRFTIPVPGATQNKKINEFDFSVEVRKTLATIKQSYAKAPYFESVYPIVEKVLTQEDRSIVSLCKSSVVCVFEYLNIEKNFYISSKLDCCGGANAAERLIEISKKLGCDKYINSPGGINLYNKEQFAKNGIELYFIKMNQIEYKQNTAEFVPYLSIIDVLMWNNKADCIQLLGCYTLE